MIGLGALAFQLWFGPLRGRPTIISKINTLMQLSYLLGVMTASGDRTSAARDARGARGRGVRHHRAVGRRLRLRVHAARLGGSRQGTLEQLACSSFRSACAFRTARCSRAFCRRERAGRGTSARGSRAVRSRAPAGSAAPRASGKTHLLQATSVRGQRKPCAPDTFRWMSSRSLGVEALEGLTQLDCLCCDDVDRVVGKLDWERALFALHARDRRAERATGGVCHGAAGVAVVGAARPRLALRRKRRLSAARTRMSRSSSRRCSCTRACAASSCRTIRRAGCRDAFRATCARCNACSTRSMRRRSSPSGA